MIFKLLRFGLSGGLATLAYGTIALIASYATLWQPMTVHFVAYGLCLPISYLLQRNFTFRFTGKHSVSMPRFFVAMVATFLCSSLAVQKVQDMGYPDIYGTLSVMVVIPLISFIVMQLWVFQQKRM